MNEKKKTKKGFSLFVFRFVFLFIFVLLAATKHIYYMEKYTTYTKRIIDDIELLQIYG